MIGDKGAKHIAEALKVPSLPLHYVRLPWDQCSYLLVQFSESFSSPTKEKIMVDDVFQNLYTTYHWNEVLPWDWCWPTSFASQTKYENEMLLTRLRSFYSLNIWCNEICAGQQNNPHSQIQLLWYQKKEDWVHRSCTTGTMFICVFCTKIIITER